MVRSHHKALTNVVSFELPANCGYLPGCGTALDYHTGLKQNIIFHLNNLLASNPTKEYLLRDGTKAVDSLTELGITKNQMITAAGRAFDIDLNTLYSMDVKNELLLPNIP